MRQDAGERREVARFIGDAAQAGVDQPRIGIESLETRNDACHEPAPAVVQAGDPRPRLCTQSVRDSPAERVEVERGEVCNLPPQSTNLETCRSADRDEPGERAREAIEAGLHQGALLVLEKFD